MSMPTMSAPASARPKAIPCPSPVRQPVTMATFPVNLNASMIIAQPSAPVIYFNTDMGTWSMSVKVWFSPAIPQMKV